MAERVARLICRPDDAVERLDAFSRRVFMVTRREALASAALAAGGALVASSAKTARASQGDATGRGWSRSYSGGSPDAPPLPPAKPGDDYAPSITPGGTTLPFRIVDGTKVFHL